MKNKSQTVRKKSGYSAAVQLLTISIKFYATAHFLLACFSQKFDDSLPRVCAIGDACSASREPSLIK